jgi:DNA repair exonuclease SbcCD ATPase subunit
MRLLQLRLQNFRQHADTRIDFRVGLTGIIGPNGAGKSTILEAARPAVRECRSSSASSWAVTSSG